VTRVAGASRGKSSRPPRPSGTGGRGGRWLAGLAVCGVAVLLAWSWLGRGENLVDRTLDMERRLLTEGATGRAGRRAVDEIVRNVDRMRPEEVRRVQQSLEAEWARSLRQDVDAYFAAQAEERQSILDRSIDRSLVYKELRFAVNPRAAGRGGRRAKKQSPPAVKTADAGAATAEEKAAERRLLERYDEAVRQRARERRIDLPAWQ